MEKITYILDRSPPMELPKGSSEEAHVVWEEMQDHDFRARKFILASMNNDQQRQHEHIRSVTEIILNLKELYG